MRRSLHLLRRPLLWWLMTTLHHHHLRHHRHISESCHHDEEEEEEEEEDAEGEDADAEGEMDVDGEGEVETFELNFHETPQAPPSVTAFSKEKEIEKLRTSGSMTQSVSEIARVKNLNRLQIGRHEVEAWYFSPYPKEYAHLPILYICEFCLAFFSSQFTLSRHRKRCTMLHPPGNEIYRHEDISVL
jgi:histone acetyltransferase HTATIP